MSLLINIPYVQCTWVLVDVSYYLSLIKIMDFLCFGKYLSFFRLHYSHTASFQLVSEDNGDCSVFA